MAKFIEIDIEGEDKIQLALKAQGARQEAGLRELVDELSAAAEMTLVGLAPRSSNYILEHIGREGPVWMPGGAGGGGEWKAIVGIKEGTSKHPLYVDQGTGIYAGQGLIWATQGPGYLTGKYAPVMTFQKEGEPRRFRYWTRGQRGQRYFYMTWRVLNALAHARILAKKLL